jgi:2-oxoglutarate ferredoxin oxidoreductase subunit delta
MPETKKKPKAREIKIYRKCCKACGICVDFCPTKCLGTDELGYPVVKCLDDCIACDLCSDRCPDLAIEIIKEKEEKGEKHG